MSSYVKATNFATKDTLPTGDSNKIVKGTEIDNEFNAIAGAISSKSDLASPTFTGTPAAPTATAGTATTQIATTAFVTSALSAAYPVGSIYINASSSSNPSVLLGFGTWTAFGAGRVMVGLDASDALFDTLEETGGSKNAVVVSHTHTATSTVTDPGHKHNTDNPTGGYTLGGGSTSVGTISNQTSGGLINTVIVQTNTTGIAVATTNSTVGVSGTNANLPPYITVRMWKRTA
jgi:hypothetical protein